MDRVQENSRLVADYAVAHQEDLYRLAYSYVKDRDAALDVVQESIAKALAKAGTLREPAYLKTWFCRILINESMDYFRRGQRLVPLELLPDRAADPGPDPGERLDLYDAVDRLGEKERTVIRLRFFEDLKLEEIAQVTGANLNTVKSRLYKGLKRLKTWTGGDLDDV